MKEMTGSLYGHKTSDEVPNGPAQTSSRLRDDADSVDESVHESGSRESPEQIQS